MWHHRPAGPRINLTLRVRLVGPRRALYLGGTHFLPLPVHLANVSHFSLHLPELRGAAGLAVARAQS